MMLVLASTHHGTEEALRHAPAVVEEQAPPSAVSSQRPLATMPTFAQKAAFDWPGAYVVQSPRPAASNCASKQHEYTPWT